jgi:hypothetical protein
MICVIAIWKVWGYSLIAPVAASIPTPIKPPNTKLPTVHPAKFEIVEAASCHPGFVQRAWISSLLFSTEATPGETTLQLPWQLESWHVAPVAGGADIAIDCVDPFDDRRAPAGQETKTGYRHQRCFHVLPSAMRSAGRIGVSPWRRSIAPEGIVSDSFCWSPAARSIIPGAGAANHRHGGERNRARGSNRWRLSG